MISSPCLGLDILYAIECFPDLRQAAQRLGITLEDYRKADRFFRQNFISLFLSRHPQPDSRFMNTLRRLYALAKSDGLVANHLFALELNNDRALLACDLLDIVINTDPKCRN